MHQQVYHSRDIQAWEQRWFAQQNSALGLMQQVAWSITQQLVQIFKQKNIQNIAVCCGQGNNAGDGYYIAKYLNQFGFYVDIYGAELGVSSELKQAYKDAKSADINIFTHFNFNQKYDCFIDALFGIGLNRELSEDWQAVIQSINQQDALKIAIDVPSGLQANTGQVLPCAIKADYTWTALGLKAGLFTGKGKEYVGEIKEVSIIPSDHELKAIAQLSPTNIHLPQRKAFGHKGSYGHVLVVGGHETMGGAVIMAAESAFACGAGKVTVVCHERHHVAILTRSPNVMLKDINSLSNNDIQNLLSQIDSVSFGMGLGRDEWAKQHYETWMAELLKSNVHLVLDADALWFLAQKPQILGKHVYLTPHPGEAATLLQTTIKEIEQDRLQSIRLLQQKYNGQWVLKGAGSLTLENEYIWICTAGNAGMGTGGMGDILAGMIASLKAQFHDDIALHEIVTLHALAGDVLAKGGTRGLQAHEMAKVLYHIVNTL